MEYAAQHGYQEAGKDDRDATRVVTGGSLAEGIAGAAAAALAIIGLAGASPLFLLSIATMAVGVALLFEGSMISNRINALIHDVGRERVMPEIGTGVTAEFIAGITGIALGILALIGVAPLALVPIAAIIYGAAWLIGGGTGARVSNMALGRYKGAYSDVAREAVSATSGVQTLIGVGVVALGILALVNVAPLILSLVAMLALGMGDLLAGSAFSGKMVSAFRST